MRLKFLLFALLIVPCIAFAKASVSDNAGILNQTQEQQLNQKVQQIELKHGIKIGIVTQKSIKDYDVNQYSRALLNNSDWNIVLLIAMDSRQWSISTDASIDKKIGSLTQIENAVVARLRDNDYSGAFTTFVDSLDKTLDYYEQNGQPESAGTGGFNPIAAGGALVLSIIAGVMYRSSLIASMSNVRPAVEASEYLVKNSVKITESRDTFLYMNVQRRSKGKGGGGSGGGGGNSGGGGSSHGGSF